MNDPNTKVILIVQESLSKLLNCFGDTLEPYLYEIVPKLIINMSSENDKVVNNSHIFMNLL